MPAEATDGDPVDIAAVHADLARLTLADSPVVAVVAVTDHRSPDRAAAYKVPMSDELAAEFEHRCLGLAEHASEAELQPWSPTFRPSPHQMLVHRGSASPQFSAVEALVHVSTQPDFVPQDDFGKRNNLLVATFHDANSGDLLGTFYMSIGAEPTLERRRKDIAFWRGNAFTILTDQPLILRKIEVVVTPTGIVVAASPQAYAQIFDPLPELAEQAAETFSEVIAPLGIVNGDVLESYAQNNRNMMTKLVSIKAKLADARYASKMAESELVKFIKKNPHTNITLDERDKIVYDSSQQGRWAILKLLDDDYLHSELTNINYESGSKQEAVTARAGNN